MGAPSMRWKRIGTLRTAEAGEGPLPALAVCPDAEASEGASEGATLCMLVAASETCDSLCCCVNAGLAVAVEETVLKRCSSSPPAKVDADEEDDDDDLDRSCAEACDGCRSKLSGTTGTSLEATAQ